MINSPSRAAPKPGSPGPAKIELLVLASAAAVSSWTGVRFDGGVGLVDVLVGLLAVVALVRRPCDLRDALRVNPFSWFFYLIVLLWLVGTVDAALDGRYFAFTPLSSGLATVASAGWGGSLLADPATTMLFRALVSTALIPLLIIATVNDERQQRTIVGAWQAGAVLNALVAVLGEGLNLPVADVLRQATGDRPSGLSDHPNSLAQVSVLAVPLAVWMTARGGGKICRIAGLLSLVVLVGAVLSSQSRAGLITLVVAVVVSATLCCRTARARALSAAAGLLLIAISLAVGPALIASTRFTSSDGSQSDTGRSRSLDEAWQVFLSHPLIGLHLGAWYGELVPLILLTSGGVLLFITYYLGLARTLVRASLRGEAGRVAIAVVLLVAAWGLFNNALLERYLYWMPIVLIFGVKLRPRPPALRVADANSLGALESSLVKADSDAEGEK